MVSNWANLMRLLLWGANEDKNVILECKRGKWQRQKEDNKVHDQIIKDGHGFFTRNQNSSDDCWSCT